MNDTVATLRAWAKFELGMEPPPPLDCDAVADEIARLWEKVRVCSGALTPVSENEKRGMERVLAILDRKIAEGGGVVSSDIAAVEGHNAHHRARWSAFRECAMMLRAALAPESAAP